MWASKQPVDQSHERGLEHAIRSFNVNLTGQKAIMLRLTSVAGRFRSLVPAASSFRPDWLDASLGLEARSLTTSQADEQESKADKERE